MLRKLMKYEFRDTAKLMLVTYAALAVATLMGSLGLHQLNLPSPDGSDIVSVIWLIMLAIYMIAIIGIYAGNFIYLCSRYYKTMYSSQGYLTNTLPVKPSAILCAKALTAYVWMLISSVLSAVSVLVMISAALEENILLGMIRYNWAEFWKTCYKYTAMSPAFFLFAIAFALLLTLLYYILFVYVCMAIGQLFGRGRTGFSILAGFCLYLLHELIDTATLAAVGYSNHVTISLTWNPQGAVVRNMILLSIGTTALLTVLLYFACLYINKKRLNLE